MLDSMPPHVLLERLRDEEIHRVNPSYSQPLDTLALVPSFLPQNRDHRSFLPLFQVI
jgi:hypothetical protein